jgi:hypothetical protein
VAEARDAGGNLVFDANGDGVLDANDTSWSEMKVWQDFDQDGVTDEGRKINEISWGICAKLLQDCILTMADNRHSTGFFVDHSK